jgi:sec-independent protein translocase protein TatC
VEKIRYLHRPPEPDPKVMSFIEHLEELRRRLIIMVAAIVVFGVVGWFLSPTILHYLEEPLLKAFATHHVPHVYRHLFTSSIYGAFTLKLKIAFVSGVILAFPVILWECWAFVVPALPGNFYRYGPYVVGSGMLLFIVGAATAYEVMPLAIGFFVGQAGGLVTMLPDGASYISFVTLIVLVFGISFELPLILVMLSMVGVTNSGWLWKKRVIAFFVIFAFATIITPGADWISPLILGAILFGLYLISIVVAKAIGH